MQKIFSALESTPPFRLRMTFAMRYNIKSIKDAALAECYFEFVSTMGHEAAKRIKGDDGTGNK